VNEEKGSRLLIARRVSRVITRSRRAAPTIVSIVSIISIISWYRARISAAKHSQMYKHVAAWGTADQRTTLARTVKVNPLARLRNIVPGFSRNERMIYCSLARNRGEAAAKQRRCFGKLDKSWQKIQPQMALTTAASWPIVVLVVVLVVVVVVGTVNDYRARLFVQRS